MYKLLTCIKIYLFYFITHKQAVIKAIFKVYREKNLLLTQYALVKKNICIYIYKYINIL